MSMISKITPANLFVIQFKASVWGVINEQPDLAMQSGNYSDPNDTTIMR